MGSLRFFSATSRYGNNTGSERIYVRLEDTKMGLTNLLEIPEFLHAER